jgi:hypothetical protein
VLARAQATAEGRLIRNRASAGIYSGLLLIHDPWLGEVVDDIAIEMAERLEHVPVNEHLAINDVVGVPLPFEQDMPLQSGRANAVDEEGAYVARQALEKVKEPMEGTDTVGFHTLMFNSMLIRRPDAEERLRAKGDYLLRIEAPASMPTTEMPAEARQAPLIPPNPV